MEDAEGEDGAEPTPWDEGSSSYGGLGGMGDMRGMGGTSRDSPWAQPSSSGAGGLPGLHGLSAGPSPFGDDVRDDEAAYDEDVDLSLDLGTDLDVSVADL